jgi:hypothetical protein
MPFSSLLTTFDLCGCAGPEFYSNLDFCYWALLSGSILSLVPFIMSFILVSLISYMPNSFLIPWFFGVPSSNCPWFPCDKRRGNFSVREYRRYALSAVLDLSLLDSTCLLLITTLGSSARVPAFDFHSSCSFRRHQYLEGGA